MILNEVYFGKNPRLQKIEKKIGDFRNKYYDMPIRYGINNDPDLIEINRLFEEEFGFDSFCMHIIDSNYSFNAITLFISESLDLPLYKKDICTVSKKGYKFNKKYKIAIITCFYAGIMFNRNFTDAEILAMELHEIGHNFFTQMGPYNYIFTNIALLTKIISMSIVYMPTTISYLLITSNIFRTGVNSLIDKLMNSKNKQLIYIIDESIGKVQDIKWLLDYCDKLSLRLRLLNIFKLPDILLAEFIKIFNPISTWKGYQDEQAADNFVTMYGYGPEFASAMEKSDSIMVKDTVGMYKLFAKVPVINLMISLPYQLLMMLTSFKFVHPEQVTRIKDQADLLEHELKKSDLDPKMKKTIESDIKYINKSLNKLISIDKGIEDPDFISRLYQRMLYKYTDSKDLKAFLYNNYNKFDEYDEQYMKKYMDNNK